MRMEPKEPSTPSQKHGLPSASKTKALQPVTSTTKKRSKVKELNGAGQEYERAAQGRKVGGRPVVSHKKEE